MGLADYVKKREIGKGSFGVVFLTVCKHDRKRYVVKRIALERATEKERRNAFQEAKLLSTLKHPNIVSHRESFISKDNSYLYIAMQYCDGGDLYTRLRQQAETGHLLPETQIMDWFVQIGLSLQYLHNKNIMHRDLKTQNIFLTKKQVVKVGDLGIARVLDSDEDMATTVTGTPYYMSPELYARVPYNMKSDVWSFGCVMYEVATLKKAFNAKDYNSLAFKVTKGQIQRLPDVYPDDMDTIFSSMLAIEPDDRPTVKDILGTPYVRKHMQRFVQQFANRKGDGQKPTPTMSLTPQANTSTQHPPGKSKSQEMVKQQDEREAALDVPSNSSSPAHLASTPSPAAVATAREQRRRARQRQSKGSTPLSRRASSPYTPRTPTDSRQQDQPGLEANEKAGAGDNDAARDSDAEEEGDENDDDDDDSAWEVSTDEDEDEQVQEDEEDSVEANSAEVPRSLSRRQPSSDAADDKGYSRKRSLPTISQHDRLAEDAQDELDQTTCAELLELQLSFDVASALSPSPDRSRT